MGGGKSGMSKGGGNSAPKVVDGKSLTALRREAVSKGDSNTVSAINGIALADGHLSGRDLGDIDKVAQSIDRTLSTLRNGGGVTYSGWKDEGTKRDTIRLLGRKYYFIQGTTTLKRR